MAHMWHTRYSVLILTLSIRNETQVKSFLEVIQTQAIKEKSQQGFYKMTKWKCTSEQARSMSLPRRDAESSTDLNWYSSAKYMELSFVSSFSALDLHIPNASWVA